MMAAVEHNLDQIDGVVDGQRFRNPDNGYTVLTTTVDGQTQMVVGYHQTAVEKGAKFTAHGRWTDDPKHGRQFRFESLELVAPSTTDQIKARLLTYPGVGPATAEKIVDALGENAWRAMDADIGVLYWVVGLSAATRDRIAAHHAKQSGPVNAIRNRLLEVGAPQSLAKAIHEAYGERSLEMLNDYPYRVAAKIERFGFATAERFSRATGLDPETPDRVDAGILHALRQERSNGHCCMPPREIEAAARRVLGVRESAIDAGIQRLLDQGPIRYEHGMVFLTGTAVIEERVARRIRALTRPARVVWDATAVPSHLANAQRDAVLSVARTGVTVLTGGPGTGKSATVSAVIDAAERAGVPVYLCAPTGRAAKRLAEATGRQASTIHRLLRPITGSRDFHHDVQNPLPPGLVVVDEVSMVDLELADALLAALTPDHRLLLVGDADQLPSVGPGNILADVLEASAAGANIATIRLTQVFRQAEGSTIIANAHRLLGGRGLSSDKSADGQFYMIASERPGDVQAKILTMASNRIPYAYKLDPMSDVQVLCPTRRWSEDINRVLQQRYADRADAGFYGPGGRRFNVGDRVMQIRNDYDRNVFNGDLGVVKSHDETYLVVDFDGSEQRYKRFDLQALQLAWSMTIHKSQGGEFPAVIVPVMRSGAHPITRQLLYTAITRARSLCVLIGHTDAMQRAASTIPTKRWTRLAQRITTED